MARRYAFVVCLAASALLGVGCLNAPVDVTRPSTAAFDAKASATSSTAVVAKDVPDPCVVVTPAMVKTTMGVSVNAGVSKKSSVGGSACEFLGTNPAVDILVQFSGLPNQYYAPERAIRNPIQLGIGEKGIYKEVEYGNAFGEFVKDGRLVYVILSTKAAITSAQWKAFLVAIGEALKVSP